MLNTVLERIRFFECPENFFLDPTPIKRIVSAEMHFTVGRLAKVDLITVKVDEKDGIVIDENHNIVKNPPVLYRVIDIRTDEFINIYVEKLPEKTNENTVPE
jgi:hypothetical protein